MIKLLSHLLHFGARMFERVGLIFYRVGNLLHNFLPVLLPPRETSALLSRYYKETYYANGTLADRHTLETSGFELENWELDVCTRYGIEAGCLLVLGCGWGREAIMIAARKVEVVGLDLHPDVVAIASRTAKDRGVRACFLRGDFLALPVKPGTFDFAMLSGTMYSALPGLQTRQAWLNDVRRLLRPNGLLILSFQIENRSNRRVDRVTDRMKRFLFKVPGANKTYQKGDVCQGGHFFHLFQDELELKNEFVGAGVVIRELNWPQQYAVISYPPSP